MELSIERIREEGRARFLPVMREETAKLLAKITSEIDPKEILEIGTCIGVSALTVLSNGKGNLTTIDIDEERLEEARQNFAKFGFSDRVTVVCDDCFAAIDYLSDNRYDLIVCDGPKGHVDELYRRLKPLLNKNGVLFFDDVAFHGLVEREDYPEHKHRTIVTNMRKFVNEIANDPDLSVQKYDWEDGVVVATLL